MEYDSSEGAEKRARKRIIKGLRKGCFSVNFPKIFRKAVSKKIPGWLDGCFLEMFYHPKYFSSFSREMLKLTSIKMKITQPKSERTISYGITKNTSSSSVFR